MDRRIVVLIAAGAAVIAIGRPRAGAPAAPPAATGSARSGGPADPEQRVRPGARTGLVALGHRLANAGGGRRVEESVEKPDEPIEERIDERIDEPPLELIDQAPTEVTAPPDEGIDIDLDVQAARDEAVDDLAERVAEELAARAQPVRGVHDGPPTFEISAELVNAFDPTPPRTLGQLQPGDPQYEAWLALVAEDRQDWLRAHNLVDIGDNAPLIIHVDPSGTRTFEGVLGAAADSQDDAASVSISSGAPIDNVYY